MEKRNGPIAVFDSGVGGISVLLALRRHMPTESYLYFGDSAMAPYGTRSEAEVRALTEEHVEMLLSRGAKAIVIACNTATGAAIAHLRQKYPNIPLIGIEPAIKPAVEAHPGGRILVAATPVTLASAKFHALLSRHASDAEIIPVPCAALAGMIESGVLSGETLGTYLDAVFAPHLERPADAVVLGCTHYPFVRHAIARASGCTHLFDGGDGTARETKRRLAALDLLSTTPSPPPITILNSAPTHIPLCERLLEYEEGEREGERGFFEIKPGKKLY